MKKSELKSIIKECVKEVIFEEGVLSNIISEVAQGLSPREPLRESKVLPVNPSHSKMDQNKQKVLAAIGNNAYEDAKNKFANPALFEGTKPIPDSGGRGPLSGLAPGDAGVDVSHLPGASHWGTIAAGIKRK